MGLIHNNSHNSQWLEEDHAEIVSAIAICFMAVIIDADWGLKLRRPLTELAKEWRLAFIHIRMHACTAIPKPKTEEFVRAAAERGIEWDIQDVYLPSEIEYY